MYIFLAYLFFDSVLQRTMFALFLSWTMWLYDPSLIFLTKLLYNILDKTKGQNLSLGLIVVCVLIFTLQTSPSTARPPKKIRVFDWLEFLNPFGQKLLSQLNCLLQKCSLGGTLLKFGIFWADRTFMMALNNIGHY